jgi:ubiquinone/menaquinone biosynthesis C-methylase UbiE
MRWTAVTLLLAACRAAPTTSAGSEPRPALAASVAPAASEAPPAHPHAEHHHGAQGYHMDFSEVERFARHFDSPDRDAWQKPAEVVRLLDLRPGQVVADIGAGTGYFLSYWSKAVGGQGRVLALDVEPNMVEYMKRRARHAGWGNVEALVVAPDDPGLPPGGVDRIVIVDTWHHIDDRPAYTAKLLRALRPGGSVVVVDFTLESDLGPPAGHRLTPEQVEKELAAGGLAAQIDRTETLPKQYVVRGTRP